MNNIITKEKNEIKVFENEVFGSIRTVIIDGEPWFIAADVCRILEIKNTTDALNKQLEDFEKARLNLGLRGGDTNIISESGFYALVLRSRKPIAKPFRIWVTSEVLPSIRKTGNYISNQSNKIENMLNDMGCNMKVVYAQINNIENLLEEQSEEIKSVINNITINTRQQEKIHEAARKRVNYLLGGAHSTKYKENARSYMINLWNNLKATFHCGSSYKDLHPKDFDEAIEYIENWDYEEN